MGVRAGARLPRDFVWVARAGPADGGIQGYGRGTSPAMRGPGGREVGVSDILWGTCPSPYRQPRSSPSRKRQPRSREHQPLHSQRGGCGAVPVSQTPRPGSPARPSSGLCPRPGGVGSVLPHRLHAQRQLSHKLSPGLRGGSPPLPLLLEGCRGARTQRSLPILPKKRLPQRHLGRVLPDPEPPIRSMAAWASVAPSCAPRVVRKAQFQAGAQGSVTNLVSYFAPLSVENQGAGPVARCEARRAVPDTCARVRTSTPRLLRCQAAAVFLHLSLGAPATISLPPTRVPQP